MAEIRIIDETYDAAPVGTDFMNFWKAAAGVQRRSEVFRLVGANITGLGNIITNGRTVTFDQDGTPAMKDAVNTWTAPQTFNNLINMSGLSFPENGRFEMFNRRTTVPIAVSSTTEILALSSRANLVFVMGMTGNTFFADLVIALTFTGFVVGVVGSSNVNSPAARTYSITSAALRLSMASGTYNVQAVQIARISDA